MPCLAAIVFNSQQYTIRDRTLNLKAIASLIGLKPDAATEWQAGHRRIRSRDDGGLCPLHELVRADFSMD